jgi:ribosomal protein S18 acetylase RimI-like enzyme
MDLKFSLWKICSFLKTYQGATMRKYIFEPLTKKDIKFMIPLLSDRQNQEGKSFPYLLNSCLNEDYISRSIEEIFNRYRIVGLAAFYENEMVGYIFARIQFDTDRGRYSWVPYEGMAVKQSESSELIRQLYAGASELWLEYGCFKHFVMTPLGDIRYADAFQRLCFSIEQVHGVMDMNTYTYFKETPDISIRTVNESDKETMGDLSQIIFSYQTLSPTYAPALPEVVMEIKEGYKKIVDDNEAIVILAEIDSKAIGFQAYWPQSNGLMSPDNAVELSISGVLPSKMGEGIGTKLMNEGYKIMKNKGYQYMVTDWRVANLASSTFWPKCGFQPVIYRMVRNIDERIAWANFDNSLVKNSFAE